MEAYFYWGDGSMDLLGDGSKSLEGMNTPIPLDLHPCQNDRNYLRSYIFSMLVRIGIMT